VIKFGKDFKRCCVRELRSTDGGGLRGCENLVYVVRTQFIYAFYTVTGTVNAFLVI
jgi:hypothetical protein